MCPGAAKQATPLRRKILRTFALHRVQTFSQLEHATNARSNLLAYHLRALLEQGVLDKQGVAKTARWSLSTFGESLLPSIDEESNTKPAQQPLVVLLITALRGPTKNRQVLLLRREERPYQGYWGLLGGRLRFGETIEGAVERKFRSAGILFSAKTKNLTSAKQKESARQQAIRILPVVNERVLEQTKETTKHHFLLIPVTTILPENTRTEIGRWFALKKLPSQIIPSDALILRSLKDNRGRSASEIGLSDSPRLRIVKPTVRYGRR